MRTQISASILSSDFGRVNEEIRSVEQYVDRIHVDVMDGHFVPNLTFGAPVFAKMKSKKPFECHLMIENPEDFVEDFAVLGADTIIIHQEVCPRLNLNIRQLRKLNVKVGVSLNPATPLSTLEDVLESIDLVLLMTVNPGFGGQEFIESVVAKISELRELMPKIDIEVDGGINEKTAKIVRDAGANILVSGSYIFHASDREKAVRLLRGC